MCLSASQLYMMNNTLIICQSYEMEWLKIMWLIQLEKWENNLLDNLVSELFDCPFTSKVYYQVICLCRLHWRSEIMYWRSGFPTVCVWSLEHPKRWPIRAWHETSPGCYRHQKTQGIEGRCTRSWQLLGQTINIDLLASKFKLRKRTVFYCVGHYFVNYLLFRNAIHHALVLQVQIKVH